MGGGWGMEGVGWGIGVGGGGVSQGGPSNAHSFGDYGRKPTSTLLLK